MMRVPISICAAPVVSMFFVRGLPSGVTRHSVTNTRIGFLGSKPRPNDRELAGWNSYEPSAKAVAEPIAAKIPARNI